MYLCMLLIVWGLFAGSLGLKTFGTGVDLLEIEFKADNPKIYRRPGGDAALIIEHRYSLLRLADFDLHKQILTLDVWEYMSWTDDRLSWDPEFLYPVVEVRVPPSRIWLPDLEIYNKAAPIKEKLQNPKAFVNHTGEVVFVQDRQIQTYCDIDDYIAAGQQVTCKITLGSWTYDSSEIDFKIDKSRMDEQNGAFHSNPNWVIESTGVEKKSEKFDCCPATYVSLTYLINLKRTNHISCQ